MTRKYIIAVCPEYVHYLDLYDRVKHYSRGAAVADFNFEVSTESLKPFYEEWINGYQAMATRHGKLRRVRQIMLEALIQGRTPTIQQREIPDSDEYYDFIVTDEGEWAISYCPNDALGWMFSDWFAEYNATQSYTVSAWEALEDKPKTAVICKDDDRNTVVRLEGGNNPHAFMSSFGSVISEHPKLIKRDAVMDVDNLKAWLAKHWTHQPSEVVEVTHAILIDSPLVSFPPLTTFDNTNDGFIDYLDEKLLIHKQLYLVPFAYSPAKIMR